MKYLITSLLLLLAVSSVSGDSTFEEYRCWGTTKVAVYMTDQGWREYIRTEYLSPYCGAQKPTLKLVVDNDWGDRFKPIRVDVQYFTQWGGRSNNWEFEVTAGRAEKVGHELHIYGDGLPSDYTEYLTIYTPAGLTEDAGFVLNAEPRCARTGNVDCLGYEFRGPRDGYIYYNDVESQVVTWELGMVLYSPTDLGMVEEGSSDWKTAQQRVDYYNETYERGGIHVRYELKAVARAPFTSPNGAANYVRDRMDVDVGIGVGATCPNTCGCAYASTYFQEGTGIAPTSVSACGPLVDLHEIGHSVGLAHGPDNDFNEAVGYIWPEFGHGLTAPFCGRFSDIMSYGSSRLAHNNSQKTCAMYREWSQYVDPLEENDPAGSREYADAAYHLNRIRYDVSLISRDGQEARPLLFELIEEQTLIKDDAQMMDPSGELRKKDIETVQTASPVGPSTVTIDNTYGDRFKPVVATVYYEVDGVKSTEWSYEVTGGRVERVDEDTLHIYSTEALTESEDHVLIINGHAENRSFVPRYTLKPEPRCVIVDGYDCLGYEQNGGWDLVYYGEDDTQMVDVELLLTVYSPGTYLPVQIDEDDPQYAALQERVDWYNAQFEADDIYIRFVIHSAWYSKNTSLADGALFVFQKRADIGLGLGFTEAGTCGVARPGYGFYQPGFGFQKCLQNLAYDLHELGHVAGLAHGPTNTSNADRGYIFPQFGHGSYGMCAPYKDDIMAYGQSFHFYNSRQTCDERVGTGGDKPAGDRTSSDSAYHWNRVRYDLALINYSRSTNQRYVPDTSGPIIID